MPDVIQLTAGDTIILRNDDTAPHMILYAFLMPGETHERTFTTRARRSTALAVAFTPRHS